MKHQIHLLTLLVGSLAACSASEIDVECPRYCPEEVKAAFFSHILESRLKAVLEAVTNIQEGIKDMKESLPKFAEKLKERDNKGDSLDWIREEISTSIKVHSRQWNRISDTQMDVLDPSRSPKAPKTLTDLLNTIKELPDAYRTSGESLDAAIVESLADVGKVFKPLVLVVEQMIKVGGEKVGLDHLQSNVNNLLGRVLLKLVQVKQEKKKVEKPRIYEDLILLAEELQGEFHSKARRMKLEDFWKMTIDRLARRGIPVEGVDEVDLLAFYLNTSMRMEDEADQDIKKILTDLQGRI